MLLIHARSWCFLLLLFRSGISQYMIIASKLGLRQVMYAYTVSDDIQDQSLEFTTIPFTITADALSYNPVDEMVYWADALSIRRVALDGTNDETLISKGTRALTLDVERQSMYFYDALTWYMKSCDVTGANCQNLFMLAGGVPIISMKFDESMQCEREEFGEALLLSSSAGQKIFYTYVSYAGIWSVNADVGSDGSQGAASITTTTTVQPTTSGERLTTETAATTVQSTTSGNRLASETTAAAVVQPTTSGEIMTSETTATTIQATASEETITSGWLI
ncbi:uncharacterized protein LOC117103421 [Anneissia japonica]|uniref:uncharacterized protein LOC117103421 n=1 Tax=Anneissia japonica TaxID=1529436 RepID=UPI001425632E|nr:uncharacterized protein LOC117103421 [Anneissia japonica]